MAVILSEKVVIGKTSSYTPKLYEYHALNYFFIPTTMYVLKPGIKWCIMVTSSCK